jgi:hypothetical protein
MKLETVNYLEGMVFKVEGDTENRTYLRLWDEDNCCWYMTVTKGFLAVHQIRAEELEDAWNALCLNNEGGIQ